MDVYASFATDEAAEEEGVVHFLVDGKTDPAVDPWIRVARINNAAYSRQVTKVYEALQAQKKAERLTEEQVEIRSKNDMIGVFADTLLKGFGNLTFKGDVLAPGRESHMTLLRVKDFREKVILLASDFEHYRAADAKAHAGN